MIHTLYSPKAIWINEYVNPTTNTWHLLLNMQ
jgi:hypothetical protein